MLVLWNLKVLPQSESDTLTNTNRHTRIRFHSSSLLCSWVLEPSVTVFIIYQRKSCEGNLMATCFCLFRITEAARVYSVNTNAHKTHCNKASSSTWCLFKCDACSFLDGNTCCCPRDASKVHLQKSKHCGLIQCCEFGTNLTDNHKHNGFLFLFVYVVGLFFFMEFISFLLIYF